MSPDLALSDGWSLPRRLAFRFTFLYGVLYLFPSPLGDIPGFGWMGTLWDKLWDPLVRGAARHLFHITTPLVAPNGSGDTTYNYIQVFLLLVIALAGALLWSLLRRSREGHARLESGLRVFVRLGLGTTMLGYGFAKVLKTQFPFPYPFWLDQSLGNSSPMRLVWAFMGYSTAYNIFTGGAEVLGGLLLFFRRTTTLGALVLIGVMSNVVMLNFCYDVPVKLYSAHLLLMALWLLWPDLRRLADVLLFHRPVEGRTFEPHASRRWLTRTGMGLKLAFLGWTLFAMIHGALILRAQRAKREAENPIAGLYEVEGFVQNGVEHPPLVTDGARWRRVNLLPGGTLAIRTMDDGQRLLGAKLDAAAHTLTIQKGPQAGAAEVLTFTQTDAEHLTLEGRLEGQAIQARLRKVDVAKFPLVSRGFHWINEVPYNR